MSDSVQDLFERLAERGAPRGATSVLEAARSSSETSYLQADEATATHRRSRQVLVGLAVIVIIVVLTALVVRPHRSREVSSVGQADRNGAIAALDQAHEAVTDRDDDRLCQLASRPDLCHSLLDLGFGQFGVRPTALPTVLDGRELPVVDDGRIQFPGGYLLDVCGELPDGSIYVSQFVLLNGGRGVMGELYWTDYRLSEPLGSGAGSSIPSPEAVAACRSAL